MIRLMTFLLFFCACPSLCLAHLINPRVLPNPALAGEIVSLVVSFDGCGGYEPPDVQIAVNVIAVRQEYFDICGVPIPGYDLTYPLGGFAPDQYTVQYITIDSGLPPDNPISLPFRVTGALPTAVAMPTLGSIAEIFLVLLLLLGGSLCAPRVARR